MSNYVSTVIDINRIVEVRVLGPKHKSQFGFFDDIEAMRSEVQKNGKGAFNYYMTVNRIGRKHVKELTNTLMPARRGASTKDAWIERITQIPFDFDPVRPKGYSSTHEELQFCIARAERCREYLCGQGWHRSLLAESGSGSHVVFRTDLPNDEDVKAMFEELYSLLGKKFSCEEIKFDETVRSPGQIMKLYGTQVWYPESTPKRPLRRSEVKLPGEYRPITMMMLYKAIKDNAPKLKTARKMLGKHKPPLGKGDLATLDTKALAEAKGIYKRTVGDKHFVTCPWISEHTGDPTGPDGTDTYFQDEINTTTGKAVFKCSHAHCDGKGIFTIANHWPETSDYCMDRYSVGSDEDRMDGESEKRERKSAAGTANDVALELLKKHDIIKRTIGTTYEYDGTIWTQVDDDRIKQLTMDFFPAHLNSSKNRNEATAFIKAFRNTKIDKWNDTGPYDVAFQEGVLNAETMVMGKHKREHYLQCVVPHTINKRKTDCGFWLDCLEQWFDGDPDKKSMILVLQEFFGMCLLPHNDFKKALILHGASDSGKSKVLQTIEELVGPKNVTHLDIDKMGDSSECSVLAGKLLNTVPDLSENARLDSGGFKRLTGNDEIVINEKNVPRYSYRPIASHIFACNTLPRINDRTPAVYNRLLILEFKNEIAKRDQDKKLMYKIRETLPAVLNWQLEGLRRLIEQEDFTTCVSSEKLVRGYQFDQNEAAVYIASEMVLKDGALAVTFKEFRDKFSGHLGTNNMRPSTIKDMIKNSGHKLVKREGREYMDSLIWRSGVGY